MSSDPRTEQLTPGQTTGLTRLALLGLGFLCTAVGIAGVILPGLPGVPFLLIAVWAFSRSSRHFHDWLFHHPILGEPVRAWYTYRAVPRKAKIAAVVVMSGTFGLLLLLYGTGHFIPWVAGGCMGAVAVWLVTRPNLEDVRRRAVDASS